MERQPVASSNVSSIGYDPETQALEVEFQSGGIYQYQGVSQELFDQLMNSPSKGAFLNQHIKNFYTFLRVG